MMVLLMEAPLPVYDGFFVEEGQFFPDDVYPLDAPLNITLMNKVIS